MPKTKAKRKSNSQPAAVAAAITPAASVSIVPRSLNFFPKSDLKQVGLNESLLRTNTSFLNKSSGIDPDRVQSDDTDTSLPDYIHARTTESFSGVESRHSTLKTPPPPRGFEDQYEEEFDNITPRRDIPLQAASYDTTEVKRPFVSDELTTEVKRPFVSDELAAGDSNYVDGRGLADARSGSDREAEYWKLRYNKLSKEQHSHSPATLLRHDRQNQERRAYSSDRSQRQEWKEEKETLCEEIRRLSAELGKVMADKDRQRRDLPGLPVRGPRPDWLLSTKQLAPLFAAYDEQLELRDNAYKKCQGELDTLRSQMEKIIVENVRLRMRLEQVSLSGSVQTSEWGRIQEQCKLVLEENCLLMDQLRLQEKKNFALENLHIQNMAKVKSELAKEAGDKQKLADEIDVMQKKLETIAESAPLPKTYSPNQHADRVSVADESVQCVTSDSALSKQLEESNKQKVEAVAQLKRTQREKKLLQKTLQSITKALKKSQMKVLLLRRIVQATENSTDTESCLKGLLNVIKELEMERDILLSETNKIKTLDKISEKLEKNEQQSRMTLSDSGVANLNSLQIEKELLKQKEDFEHELWHLREIIRNQYEELNIALKDKKQLQEDLEITWQAIQKDNLDRSTFDH